MCVQDVDGRLMRSVQAEGHVSRDPSRLTRPTKGWEERMKSVEPSGGGGGGGGGREGGPPLQMFHRFE